MRFQCRIIQCCVPLAENALLLATTFPDICSRKSPDRHRVWLQIMGNFAEFGSRTVGLQSCLHHFLSVRPWKKAIQPGAHLHFLLCRVVIRPSSSCHTDLGGWEGMAEGEGNNRADNLLCPEPLMLYFIFTPVPQRWLSLLLAHFKRKPGSKRKVTFPRSSSGTQPLLPEPWSSQN